MDTDKETTLKTKAAIALDRTRQMEGETAGIPKEEKEGTEEQLVTSAMALSDPGLITGGDYDAPERKIERPKSTNTAFCATGRAEARGGWVFNAS